jgi:hypothetical protein
MTSKSEIKISQILHIAVARSRNMQFYQARSVRIDVAREKARLAAFPASSASDNPTEKHAAKLARGPHGFPA